MYAVTSVCMAFFGPPVHRSLHQQRTHPPILQDGVRDAAVRAATRAAAAERMSSLPPRPEEAIELREILSEFACSEYVARICRYCSVNPADSGQISGVFESVELRNAKLDVKLTKPLTQKSDQLLGHLAEHLRARAPHIERLEYTIGGGWGTTRTWILRTDLHAVSNVRADERTR